MDSVKTLQVPVGQQAFPVRYRSLAGFGFHPGMALTLGDGNVLFCGQEALKPGLAAEVHLDAVKGVAPPLTLYVEVRTCEEDASSGYRMGGAIKGIRSV